MDNSTDKLKAEILSKYKELLKKQGKSEEIGAAESVVSEAVRGKDLQELESLLQNLKEKSQKIDEFEAIKKKILQEAGDIVQQKRIIRELTAEVDNKEAKVKDSKALERANERIERFASEPKELEKLLEKMIKLSKDLNDKIVHLTMMVEAGQDVSQFSQSLALEEDFLNSAFDEVSKKGFEGSEGGPTEFLIAAKTTDSKLRAAEAAAKAFDTKLISDVKDFSAQTDMAEANFKSSEVSSGEQSQPGPASATGAGSVRRVGNTKDSKICTVQ